MEFYFFPGLLCNGIIEMQKQKVLKGSHRTALSRTFNFLLWGQESLVSCLTSPGFWGWRLWVQKAHFVRARDKLHLPTARSFCPYRSPGPTRWEQAEEDFGAEQTTAAPEYLTPVNELLRKPETDTRFKISYLPYPSGYQDKVPGSRPPNTQFACMNLTQDAIKLCVLRLP